MSLVQPSKKDPYGLAGRRKIHTIGPRLRRIKSKPIIPKAVKDAAIDFGIEIWYSKKIAEQKKRARRRR